MSKGKRHDHDHLIPHQGEPADLAARLTPLEETQRLGSDNGGAIVVDAAALKLPKDFTERQEKEGRMLGLEPITLVILAFSLAFIAFIAYLISTGPAKAGDDGPKAVMSDE